MAKRVEDSSRLKILVGKSDSESIYICPFCEEEGKSPDKTGKMYFSERKQVGHCFRCGTIVVDKSEIKSKTILLRRLEEMTSTIDPTVQLIKDYNIQNFDLEGWSFNIRRHPKLLNYMLDRGISVETLEKFKVRACLSPRPGIVFINKLKDNRYTDFFQIRNLVGKMRHTSMKNTIKPVCWMDEIHSSDVVLVEGFTSGLSVFEFNNSLSPIVTTGKSLSDIQLNQLNKKFKEKHFKLTICYDGGFFEDSLKVAKNIHSKCLGMQIFLMNLPKDKDPNDVSKKVFIKRFNEKVKYNPLNLTIIRNIVYNRR